ncbi:MAG: type II toxin-antitoxin system Phd/YefM family antitoxin [Gammaproteobacteria bacterium]
MLQASVRELRSHTKELLDAVNRGEEVIITSRGKGYAKLVPLAAEATPENELFGLWKDNSKTMDVEGFIKKVRASRHDID